MKESNCLTSEEILQIIEDNNLSIRRIPMIVAEVNDIRHLREGDEIITRYFNRQRHIRLYGEQNIDEREKSFKTNFPQGRNMCKRYKVPTNAGWYMCHPVNHTSSRVEWSDNKFEPNNLAPTLGESIQLFLQHKAIMDQEKLIDEQNKQS